MTGNFSKCTMICDFHTALKIPYVYEFIIKSCRQQMEVMQKLNTSCPHSVLILRGLSCQLSRWSIVGIGFRFVPLDSPMCVVPVTVHLPASHISAYAGLSRANGCQQAVLMFDSIHVCFIAVDPRYQTQ